MKISRSGYGIDLAIDVPFGKTLAGGLHGLRSYILNNIQKYTGIVIDHLKIEVEKVTQRKPKLPKKQ